LLFALIFISTSGNEPRPKKTWLANFLPIHPRKMQIRVPKVFKFETIAIIRRIQKRETNLARNNSPE